ncbi:MAG: glucose 1-dehydrogenase [Pseudomonadota bacterium]
MSGMVDGKVALITGAARGIGLETTKLFLAEGASVLMTDVLDDIGEEACAALQKDGHPVSYMRCDVSKAADVAAAVQAAVDRYGSLDCAVNNAGIEGQIAFLKDYDADQFSRVVDINLRGVFNGLQAEIRQMLAQGTGGAIVNLSSLAGVVGFANLGPYVMSKHGVNGLTKTAAIEHSKDGIRTNSVCPGCIQTDMIDALAAGSGLASAEEALGPLHPLGRQGRPNEVAEAILWLCSDRASNVTGSIVTVDGGYTSQ